MTAYIVRRLLATLPVMAIVAVCVFLLLHLSPGDPAAVIAGDNATPANIEMIRKRLGLDASGRAARQIGATIAAPVPTTRRLPAAPK